MDEKGPLIAISVFSLRPYEKEDLFAVDHQVSEIPENSKCSPRPAGIGPVSSFSDDDEDERYSMDLQESERCGDITGLTERAINKSVVSFKIKEEEESCFVNFQNSERQTGISSPTGEKVMKRKRNYRNSAKYTKKTAVLGKLKTKVSQSSENRTKSRRKLLPRSNQELAEEIPALCDSGFMNETNQERIMPLQCTEYEKNLDQMKMGRTAISEGPYICAICQKSFSKMSNLIRHQATHGRVRPYQCTECEKSFNRNDNLIRHQRSHTKDFQAHLEMWGNTMPPYDHPN